MTVMIITERFWHNYELDRTWSKMIANDRLESMIDFDRHVR